MIDQWMDIEIRLNDFDRVELKSSEKNLTQSHFILHKCPVSAVRVRWMTVWAMTLPQFLLEELLVAQLAKNFSSSYRRGILRLSCLISTRGHFLLLHVIRPYLFSINWNTTASTEIILLASERDFVCCWGSRRGIYVLVSILPSCFQIIWLRLCVRRRFVAMLQLGS